MLGAVCGLSTPTVSEAKTADAPAASANIAFERYKLDNGLEVILHRDPSTPQVAVNVWYHVGSGDEVVGRSGFAHLFEHMMFQGAKHIGEDVHFDILKQIGGTYVNGTTNTDRTNYFEMVPSNHLETALWLESDRMGYMLDLLNEKSLANQQEVVRNERRQRYDNVPYGRDRFAVAEILYPEGHPYRYLTIGRHEDLEAAKLEDVRAFFQKWYVPSNATLTLAGDFEIAQAKALVQKWFGTFPAIAQPARVKVVPPALAKTERRELEDTFARLVQVHYVWHAPAYLGEGSFELDAASEVLGAQGWGRLYKRLVVGEKLAQAAYSYNHGKQASGEFHVVVRLKPGADSARVEAIVQEEIAKITTQPITEAELNRVKIGIESGFVWGLEELMGRANRLQSFNHFAGDPGYITTYLSRVRAIDVAGVQREAQKWLATPRAEIITRPAKPVPHKGRPRGGTRQAPAAKGGK